MGEKRKTERGLLVGRPSRCRMRRISKCSVFMTSNAVNSRQLPKIVSVARPRITVEEAQHENPSSALITLGDLLKDVGERTYLVNGIR